MSARPCLVSPPPLWGRSRAAASGWGVSVASRPPTPTLPHKGGGRILQCGVDHFDDAVRIFQAVIVPETQQSVALRLKDLRTRSILFELFVVLSPVDFDDESRLEAEKIHNIGSNRRLPTKSMAVDLLAAQSRPQSPFGLRQIATELASNANRHRWILAGLTPLPNPPPRLARRRGEAPAGAKEMGGRGKPASSFEPAHA